MNNLLRWCCFLILFLFAEFAHSGDAHAHGTGHRVLSETHPVAVSFYYADQSPMAYAEVLVFSPTDQKVEYQNGRTDKNGLFAFCPDGPGNWRIKADDGMGHAAEAFVEVTAQGASGAEKATGTGSSVSSGPSSTGLKVIAGLSLILNLSLLGLLMGRKRSPKAHSQ